MTVSLGRDAGSLGRDAGSLGRDAGRDGCSSGRDAGRDGCSSGRRLPLGLEAEAGPLTCTLMPGRAPTGLCSTIAPSL